MTPPTPTVEPTKFVAGDSLSWDVAVSDYPPADGWALTYAFRGPGSLDLGPSEVTATASLYQVRVPASKTSPLLPGIYVWEAYATLGSESHVARSGSLVVAARLSALESFQSKAEAELVLVEAAIAAVQAKITAAGGIKAFTIASRSVTYQDQVHLKELRRQRGFLRAQVRQERHPGVLGETVGVSFRAPR